MSSSSSSSSSSKKYFNCLLATHNNILQCTIDKLIPRKGGPKIRFKNCAILCLTIDLDTTKIVQKTGITDLGSYKFKLELVYNGLLSEKESEQVSEDEKLYYVKEDINDEKYKTFIPITDFITEDKILNLLPEDISTLKNKLEADAIRFYIVRHGQAEHNEKNFFSRSRWGAKIDTSVTQLGQQQATQAASEFENILGPNQHIDIVFASDLQRTRQTLLPFFELPNVILEKTIIIDPCANELGLNGDGTGNCWEKTASSWKKLSRENYPDCTPKTCPVIKSLTGDNITIDWRLYSLFYKRYKKNIRGYPDSRDYPNCANTNMISMAVFYLLNLYKPIAQEPEYKIEYDEDGNIMVGGRKTRNRKRNYKKKTIRRVRGKSRGKYRK
jgi:broad specificity phosphatase PhoE